MNRDKQTVEMQNDLIEISKSPYMIDGLDDWSDVIAEKLIAKGYRKASEVAKEIGDEIAKNLYQVKALPNFVAIKATVLINIIEKYTESER